MPRPTRILVSPHWVDIKVDINLSRNSDAVGLCAEDKQEIYIDGDLGPSIEKETLLHEAMHQIWHQTELDRKYKDSDEEAVIWSLAPRLLALILNNPGLIEWLQES